MDKDAATRDGGIERRIDQLGNRLDSILGRGRIPRREKKAKAEAAMQAVDELVEAIDQEIGEICVD